MLPRHLREGDDAGLTGRRCPLALRDARMIGEIEVETFAAGARHLRLSADVNPNVAGALRAAAGRFDRARGLLLRILAFRLGRSHRAVHRGDEHLRIIDAVLFTAAPASKREQ